MDITVNTRVSEVLREYGDIAEVMEVFGVQRVGRFLDILRRAVAGKERRK